MQDDDSPRRDLRRDLSPTEREDAIAERAVLTQVLLLHPDHLTIPELVRETAAGSEDFAEGDAMERAVCDLISAGLLHCRGAS